MYQPRRRFAQRASSPSGPRRPHYGLIGLGLLMFGPLSGLAAEPAKRFEVPIIQRRLSDGVIRFGVSVRVGASAPIEAMLDTGSFGLRIMARALAPTEFEPIGITRGYGFASGVVLQGPLARARIAIGDATTNAPVGIQVVRSVGCAAAKPDCPAARLAPTDYGIGGDGLRRQGFEAILGLSMRGSDAPGAAVNPVPAMGAGRWIVILPRPGTATPGQLIINPSASDVAGFHPVRLRSEPSLADGRPRVIDTEIPGCPDSPLDEQASCPPMMLDSGAVPGLRPFYAYEILFDQWNGIIAVKPR
jgi:hypothetical protein